MALCAGTLALAPFALLFGEMSSTVWPWAAASAALELAYFGLLATAYSRSDLSVVYPVSRGVAPVLVLIVAALALGADPSAFQAGGVVGVGLGVLLVRDLRAPPGRSDLLLSLTIGCAIAGYTLVDNEGVEHANALAYLALVLAPPATVYLGVMLRLRGAAVRAAVGSRAVLAGLGMCGAYALVLAALELAPAAPVAAVRETSVLIATVLAGRLLSEEVSGSRLAGAGLIVAGIAALALG